MKPQKIILLFLFSIFIISFAQSQLVYKQGEVIDLKFPCVSDGGYCSTAAYCNMTLIYIPNSTTWIDNQLMTNQGSYHNYTLTEDNANKLGVYGGSMSCTDLGVNGTSTFELSITNTGVEKISSGESTILIIMIISLLALSLFFFVLGMKVVNPIMSLGLVIASGITLFILVLTTMDFIIENLSQLGTIVATYRTVLTIVKWMVSLGITSLVLYTGWRALQLFRIKRGLSE